MFGEFISDKLSELSKRTFFYVMRMIHDVVLIIWTTFYGVFILLSFLLLSGGEVFIKGKILVVCAFIHICYLFC